jgi:hypothetical protein
MIWFPSASGQRPGRVISLGYNAPVAVETVTQHFMAGHILDPGDLLTAFAAAVTHPLDRGCGGAWR